MPMFKKLFGNRDGSEKLPDRAHLERLLAEIALATPPVNWIALVKSSGIFISSFPSKPEVNKDTIAAMSAAMSSLGGRIASELKDGELQYLLIAGTSGISVTFQLSPDYLLSVGLDQETSIEEFLIQMQEIRLPHLMKALGLAGTLRL